MTAVSLPQSSQHTMSSSLAEILSPPTEPTFVGVYENAARDALRRSADNRSTKSWIQSLATVPPVDPQPEQMLTAATSPRSARILLHTANPDSPSEEEEEPMNIRAVLPPAMIGNPIGNGQQYHYSNERKTPPKTLVDGFMSGIRRFPRAVMRYGAFRRHTRKPSSDGTFATLPRYSSQPATPQVAQMPPSTFINSMSVQPEEDDTIPETLRPGVIHTHRTPSFHITPADEEHVTTVLGTQIPGDIPPRPSTPHPISHPQYDSTYTTEPTVIQVPSSPHRLSTRTLTNHTNRTLRVDTQTHLSPAPSRRSNVQLPPENPPSERPESVLAHPQPTGDYLRMHRPFSEHGHGHGHGHHSRAPSSHSPPNSSEPSFSSELNGCQRFFSALVNMPWISPDRITVDYRPGMNRGAWTWKRVSLIVSNTGSIRRAATRSRTRKERGERKKGTVLLPIHKPLASWYTSTRQGGDAESEGIGGVSLGTKRHTPSWAGIGAAIDRDDILDLFSSGSATRSSMTSSKDVSSMSSPLASPILRPFTVERPGLSESRRRTVKNQATSTPAQRQRILAESSKVGVRPLPTRKRDVTEYKSQRHRETKRRHHSKSKSPLPFSFPYPNPTNQAYPIPAGYMPAFPMPTHSPTSPQSPQIPMVVPQTPVYLVHTPPQSQSDGNGEPIASGSGHGTTGNGNMPVYTYMSFVPAQGYIAQGNIQSASPGSSPGMAGRGIPNNAYTGEASGGRMG